MLELVEAEPYTLIDRKSRFVAELFHATTPDEAKGVIAAQRQRYPDCSHVVHAMSLGENAGILGCSDDGEPSGTAGRPVLEVLKGSRISQVVLTVTRWFGGTKLGTGGLVHAYSEAAKGVIASARTRERIATSQLEFRLPYAILDQGRRILLEAGFTVAAENYDGEGVMIAGSIPRERVAELAAKLRDLSRGAIDILATASSP